MNDDRLAVHYNGMEVIVNKRYSKGSQLLASYDYSHTRQDLLGLVEPEPGHTSTRAVRAAAAGTFSRLSGSRELPGQIQFAANFRWQSGLPFTRHLDWCRPAPPPC